MQYKWPLAQNEFSWLDRLKICSFFLKKSNRWSQDKYIKQYESKMAEYTGSKYAVATSSGSSSNQLICQYIKDDLIKNSKWPQKNQVIVNSVTWQSNVSVWIREGFEPIFIDVNLEDFCLDYKQLEDYLKIHSDKVACVFPTSVLGFVPDVNKLKTICTRFSVPLKFDNCESIFGQYESQYESQYLGGKIFRNVCGDFTSSTSGFVAHQITSGAEFGLIFTNSKEEFRYYLMARAHGLIRNLHPYKEHFDSMDWNYNNDYDVLYNPLVDSQFDFNVLSSNYRSSDISAYCSLLDFKRIDQNKKHRKRIYNLFYNNIDHLRYYLPSERQGCEDTAFCLPIIIKLNNIENANDNEINRLINVKKLLDSEKVEKRGFISGNMLRQTNYQKYGDYKDYKVAEYLNNFGQYIGLNGKAAEKQVLSLVEKLNLL